MFGTQRNTNRSILAILSPYRDLKASAAQVKRFSVRRQAGESSLLQS